MIDAPLALAFASGLVAAVNPCGFAMLPAYVGFFLGTEGDRTPGRGETVVRAIPVAIAVSLGFVAVFGIVGIVLRPIRSSIQEYAPYATVVIGLGLVGFGVATLAGLKLSARLPQLGRGGRSRGLGSMFLYGVSYAIASLTCTLPVFAATVVGAFTRTDFVSGMAVMVMYAFGMAMIVTTLTLAIALTRDSVVGFLRAGMRHANRVGGVLMVLMGAYVTWYGIFSLRVRNNPRTAGGPADLVDRWSRDISQWVNDTGAVEVGFILGGIIVAIVCASVIIGALRSPSADRTPAEPQPQR